MKSNAKVITVILAVTAVAVSIITAQSCNLVRGESYSVLKAADLTALADTLPAQQQRQLAQNAGERKNLITNVKQFYSLAMAAQDAGLDKTDKFKQQFAFETDKTLVGELMSREPQTSPAKGEGEAYLKAHAKDFDALFKVLSEGEKQLPSAEQMETFKTQWADMKVLADKARKTGLDKDPKVQAQMKFLRPQLLAGLQARALQEKLKPSAEELKKYYAEHPEVDADKLKKKAEDTLARVKKGEDFAAVAKEVSDDKASGEKGGDLDWKPKGASPPELENAAFAMQPGQISDLIKTKYGWHIIKLEERRKVEKKDDPAKPGATPADPKAEDKGPQEEYRARHIMISTQEADGVEPMLAQKSFQRAVEDATLKYPVRAPEDFVVNAPGLQPGLKLPGLGGGQGGQMAPITPDGRSAPDPKKK